MRQQDDLRALVGEFQDGRRDALDAGRVGHLAVGDRHVEVDADQHALAPDVADPVERLECGHRALLHHKQSIEKPADLSAGAGGCKARNDRSNRGRGAENLTRRLAAFPHSAGSLRPAVRRRVSAGPPTSGAPGRRSRRRSERPGCAATCRPARRRGRSPVILPSSSTSRTISSIGPSVTRSAYSARPPSRCRISAPIVSFFSASLRPGRIGGFEVGRRPAGIDGEGAEEIGVFGIDFGAAGEQPVEQARIAVRHEDVDVVAGHQPAHVLEAHRAAVAHDQRRPRPARNPLAARHRAAGHDGIGEQFVMRRARQFELDLFERADAGRHDEAEPARQPADRPALHDQRHQHDDEGDVEDLAAVLEAA